MNSALERMCEEVVVAWLHVLFSDLPEWIEKTWKMSAVRIACLRTQYLGIQSKGTTHSIAAFSVFCVNIVY
jgi:hypothetical protein